MDSDNDIFANLSDVERRMLRSYLDWINEEQQRQKMLINRLQQDALERDKEIVLLYAVTGGMLLGIAWVLLKERDNNAAPVG